jgi:two-component system, chemotaxis family, chemotaxis protein CheY
MDPRTRHPEGRSVLVVDDDPDVRASLVDVLASAGFSVASAEHGRAALDLLRAGAPIDLILLDMMMPVMNGWQFCKERASDPALERIPVLVLSAVSHVAGAAATVRAAGYLRKPIEVSDLVSMVQEHMGAGSA